VPRLALEPIGWGGRGPLQRLLSSTDVLTDLASTLAPLGPCSMRVASELNLYDSPYHVPTTSPAAMDQMCHAFAEVHAVFSARAPNVAITFSPFIPNGQTREERRHSLRLIARYLPVLDRHVDMFTGTFYARSPEEVDGLRGYARLVWHTGKPFGIDELGCHDEDTFQTVMDSLVEGRLGEPRFINFFDYHVEKPHVDHPWQLKAADKRLLTRLHEQGKIVDG